MFLFSFLIIEALVWFAYFNDEESNDLGVRNLTHEDRGLGRFRSFGKALGIGAILVTIAVASYYALLSFFFLVEKEYDYLLETEATGFLLALFILVATVTFILLQYIQLLLAFGLYLILLWALIQLVDLAPQLAGIVNEEGVKDAWNLLFFLCNFLICLLGYKVKYDPSGTENPRWTGVWG